MTIAIAQVEISRDIQCNTEKIIEYIKSCEDTDVLVFPEEMISGYYPEDEQYITKLNPDKITEGIKAISQEIREKNIEVIIGTALYENSKWYNTTFWFNQDGTIKYLYKKCNLSNLDRNHFTSGSQLEVIDFKGISSSIQMCREIKYPEQWLYLRLQGSEIIFHINNSQVQSDEWLSLYRTRAYENEIYVVSVNPTYPNQKFCSYTLSPKGEVLLQTEANTEKIYYFAFVVNNHISKGISQRRTDLVDIVYKGK